MGPFRAIGWVCCAFCVPLSARAQEIWHWDGVGSAVSGTGDLDGDGTPDLLLGRSGFYGGSAHVFSGATGLELLTFSSSVFGFACSLSGCGDVDGDSVPDLIIGANEPNGGGATGRAFVYSGATGGTLYSLAGDQASSEFGNSVSGAGDLDGDGRGDFLIGAPFRDGVGEGSGSAYAYSGATGSVLFAWDGEAKHDTFGTSVAGGDDVDLDGVPDPIVSARWASFGAPSSGSVYVFSGRTGARLLRLDGETSGLELGAHVASAGDVDRDGHGDLLAEAFTPAGQARVYSGRLGTELFRFNGRVDGDYFGWSLARALDVNRDGFEDLLIGAFFAFGDGLFAGTVELHSGRTGALLYHWNGDQSQVQMGIVGTAGDVNGDGFADVLIGAPAHPIGGRAYVFAGRPIFLDANYRLIWTPLTLTLTTGEGTPNAPAALFAVDVNGTPTSLLIATGRLDANGSWQVATHVSTGLSGLEVTLRSYVLDPATRVAMPSNDEKIRFL